MAARFYPRISTSIIAMVALCSAGAALAESQEGVFELDTIVIVGTGLPTEIRDNPASVSALEADDIKRVPPTSVARILDQVPGVRVTQSGIERITIRGEDSQRVSILIDGQPLTDHTGYGTPILVSPASIERIEIVRGSSSVVSGNNAIGGVVNIITKRGADVPLEITASAGYIGATGGYRSSLSAAGSNGNFDYRLTYSKSDQGDVKTPQGDLPESDVQDRDISLMLGYRADNHYFGFRAQDYDLAANVGSRDPNFQVRLPKRDLRKYGVFYEGENLTPWLNKVTVDAYTQEIDRQFLNDITVDIAPGRTLNVVSTSDDLQETGGINAKAEMSFGANHRTIVGFSYEDDSLISDKTTVQKPSFVPFASTTLRYSDAHIKTFSVFGQHEISFSDKLTGTFGLRYYDVQSERDVYLIDNVPQGASSNSDDRLVGAAGLVYKPSEDVSLRANISQGYKYPTLAQLYLETSAGRGGVTRGNPNLKPESSTTFEIGGRVDRAGISFDGTVFYSDAKDYIATVSTSATDFEYRNVNSAKTWGIELGAEFDPVIWGLRPHVTAEYLQREFSFASGVSTKDTGTPDISATIGVRRDWALASVDGEWDLFLAGEGRAIERDDTGAVTNTYGGYATLNFALSAALTENVTLNFAANNLLDKSYTPVGQYEGAGRNFSLFLSAVF